MVFKEREVIELSGGKKYMVAKTLNQNDCWYYCLMEVNKEETEVMPVLRIITTVTENGNIFVKNVKGQLAMDLELVFKEKLNID